MKTAFLAATLALTGLHAAEVTLYDCDYTNSPSLVGQSIPLTNAPLPERNACGEVLFGQVVIANATAPWSGTTAQMKPLTTGSFYYSQMSFPMITGGVYAFRKHRYETVFKFPSSQNGDSLTILTDGGVTYSLTFYSTGSVVLFNNKLVQNPIWGERVETEVQTLAPFDPSQPVHLIWETDIDGARTTVTINGNATTATGLSPVAVGLRNWQMFPGPFAMRMNFASNVATRHLALRSVRITGDDYDGPLFVEPLPGAAEANVTVVRFQRPSSGIWQPQFSIDGTTWKNYSAPVSADSPYDWISFGTKVSPSMLFRVKQVSP